MHTYKSLPLLSLILITTHTTTTTPIIHAIMTTSGLPICAPCCAACRLLALASLP